MYQIKEVVHEIKLAAKRRKKLLISIPILFTVISIGASYSIPKEYMSSTSILVQKDETLNPLLMYEMAVSTVSDDRLQSFNEIIYSRSTMEMLIDSLGLDETVVTERERQALVESLKQQINTSLKGSDSFYLNYYDQDPVRAKEGVEFLASHFIKTRLNLENRRNEETVNFFQEKLIEMEEEVEEQRSSVETVQKDRLRTLPVQTEALQARLQDLEMQLETINWQIYEEEQRIDIIADFISSESNSGSITMLHKLSVVDLPNGEELSTLLSEYDELSQQFTESYPRLRALRPQITQLVKRIEPALRANLSDLETQKREIINQRNKVINDLESTFVANQKTSNEQSEVSIYEGLLAEIKVKLEQAKMNRDIGAYAAEQFVVLDAPFVPEKPAKPNKRLIVIIGFIVGSILAVILSGIAEVLDTTIRRVEDLPVNKPVIAYLTTDA